MAKLAELPTTLDFLLDFPGGGLAWVGSYGPGRRGSRAPTPGMAVLEEHGFPPFLVARPMEGGRYFVLRFVACFDQGDADEVERVRARAWASSPTCVLDHGYVPYKASADAGRADPRPRPSRASRRCSRRVRDALDPDRRHEPRPMAGHVASPTRALFERLPRLVDLVPFVELADGLPTPVEQVDDRLWVQRDDVTDSHYGGNKVRKLEFVLPIARRGRPGAHGRRDRLPPRVATAVHAARLGLEVEAVRYPQPETAHVNAVDQALRALPNVRHTMVPHRYTMPAMLIVRRAAIERAGGYAVLPGATSPLGVLGYVSAALELIDAFSTAGWAPPDDVVVALGSGGSAAGITIGLQLGGWSDTTVVGVRVADAVVTNRALLAAHAVGTFALLGMGGWRPRHGNIVIDRRYLGAGYGHPTDAGERAIGQAAGLGLALESTYTAKAFASVLDRWRAGRRVVFVQTYAGRANDGDADLGNEPL